MLILIKFDSRINFENKIYYYITSIRIFLKNYMDGTLTYNPYLKNSRFMWKHKYIIFFNRNGNTTHSFQKYLPVRCIYDRNKIFQNSSESNLTYLNEILKFLYLEKLSFKSKWEKIS